MKIRFPNNTGQRYYSAHFQHCLNLFRELGYDVEFFNDDTGERGCFKMLINDVVVMVDFSDYGSEYQGDLLCLRFHVKRGEEKPNVFPFPQVSFLNWRQYKEFEKKIQYRAKGLVMHNQRPSCNNGRRRIRVRAMVEEWADGNKTSLTQGYSHTRRLLNGADTRWHGNQERFWSTLNDCLVSIHVPGQNNNMLDSAQIQLFGLGVCTISPELPEILPFNKTPDPGIHYVACRGDYSDLIEKIEWCRANPSVCVRIGLNAKQMFAETVTPAAAGAWLGDILRKIS